MDPTEPTRDRCIWLITYIINHNNIISFIHLPFSTRVHFFVRAQKSIAWQCYVLRQYLVRATLYYCAEIVEKGHGYSIVPIERNINEENFLSERTIYSKKLPMKKRYLCRELSMEIAFSEYLQHGCMFFTYSFTRVRSYGWNKTRDRNRETKKREKRERKRLRRRYLAMEATYIRVMAHVKPERVRQKTVPRGLNRHQGGSVLFYAVFSLVLDSRKSSGRGRSLYRGPRFNVCVCVCRARVSSTKSRYVLVFDARHTFFVTDPRQFGPFLRFLLLFSPPLLLIASFSQSDHFLLSFLSFFFFTLFLCSQISQIIKSWSNSRAFFSLRFFFSILPPRYRISKDFSFAFLPSISLLLNQGKEISLHICFFASSPPKFSLVFSSRLKF